MSIEGCKSRNIVTPKDDGRHGERAARWSGHSWNGCSNAILRGEPRDSLRPGRQDGKERHDLRELVRKLDVCVHSLYENGDYETKTR